MKIAIKAIMILLYISNWYTLYVVSGGGDVLPYKSKILNVR